MPRSGQERGPDEVILRHIAVRRWSRMGMYGFLSASGLSSVLYPELLVSNQVGQSTIILLSLAVSIGGLVACGGTVSDRWIAEYTILPVLLSALAVYGVSALFAASQQGAPQLTAYGFLLIGFALGLYARWRDVRAISKVRRSEIKYHQSGR